MSEPKFIQTVLEDGTKVVTLVKGDKSKQEPKLSEEKPKADRTSK
jgi:hypothetical protein